MHARMTAVGFEPTRIAPPELESGALDRSAKLSNVSIALPLRPFMSPRMQMGILQNFWTHWDLNPGPSACEADVIPLHHEPDTSLTSR